VRKADNLPPSCAVTKSGNPNFLEPSGPLWAYNGTALMYSKVDSAISQEWAFHTLVVVVKYIYIYIYILAACKNVSESLKNEKRLRL